MSPPPIRYPLPTLLVVIFLGSIAWLGQGVWKRAASAIAGPVKRALNGPDYPSGKTPKVGSGGITRKVLLLADDLPVRVKPGATPFDTFGRRGFANLYDFWPTEEKPTHLRVGNGRLTGWIDAADALGWDTRLVLKMPPGTLDLLDMAGGKTPISVVIDDAPLAVVAWNESAIEVASWKPGRPWSEVAKVGWIKLEAVPESAWCVLLTDAELVALRRSARKIASTDDALRLRQRAILGTILDDGTIDLSVRSGLPGAVLVPRSTPSPVALDSPTETSASWGGITFRAIPLVDLP